MYAYTALFCITLYLSTYENVTDFIIHILSTDTEKLSNAFLYKIKKLQNSISSVVLFYVSVTWPSCPPPSPHPHPTPVSPLMNPDLASQQQATAFYIYHVCSPLRPLHTLQTAVLSPMIGRPD